MSVKTARRLKRIDAETGRIRSVYANRDARNLQMRYSWTRPEVGLAKYRLQTTLARALRDAGLTDLCNRHLLDVGCGQGEWLRLFLEWGCPANQLHGLDLLEDRICTARALSPNAMDLQVGNGGPLPYDDGSMDLITASTVFSSILDLDTRTALGAEMQRVVRADGMIAVYDFVVSHPGNPDTIGIGANEIRRLFPEQTLERSYSVTLLPPLARRLFPRLPWLAHTVECLLPFLCTHRLYVLRRANRSQQTAQDS